MFSWFGNRSRLVSFLTVLALLAAVRALFLFAYPFTFGHPDAPEYVASAKAMIAGEPFRPNPMRVMGAYAYLLFGAQKLIGLKGAGLLLVQGGLGLAMLGLFFGLAWALSGSFPLALGAFFIAGILPRELFFEHILLAESLYAFVLLAFVGLGYALYRLLLSVLPARALVFLFGTGAAVLMLARAQGLVAVPLGIALIAWLGWRDYLRWRERLLRIALFLIPIAVLNGLYLRANWQRNHFPGMSIAANYNLFFLSAGNLLDFASPKNREIKEQLRPYVQLVNEHGNTHPAFVFEAVGGERYAAMHGLLFANGWPEANRVMGELTCEAVLTHPISFTARALINFDEFLVGKKNFFQTAEFSVLYLNGNRARFSIDRDRVQDFRRRSGLDELPETSSALRVLNTWLKEPSAAAGKALDSFLVAVRFLGSTQFFTLFVYLAAIVLLHSAADRIFVLWVLGLFFAQIAATVIPANAQYDRYFVPTEPLALLLGVWALASLVRFDRHTRRNIAFLCLVLPLVGWTSWIIARALPTPFPLEKPILALPVEQWRNHHSLVFSFLITASVLLGTLIAYLRKVLGVRFAQTKSRAEVDLVVG